MAPAAPKLYLDRKLFRPGERIAVAVSGGADSVALLRAMLDAAPEIGLVLSIVHIHHNLRGVDADADASLVRDLASTHHLHLDLAHVDTPARIDKTGESIEQAARHLRYEVFHRLLRSGETDAIATAHTLDDQAETVLMKFIRGAWTEGLSGIHPVIRVPETEGRIVRPFLHVRRSEIEAYLHALDQPWREDASNADTAFTRNRVRHELLPLLRRDYNPGIDSQLTQMAVLARDEDARWQSELARLLPSLLLPGAATRGGGRSTSTLAGEKSVSLEVPRLRTLDPALRRRVIRAAAEHIGAHLNFDETEDILNLCLDERVRTGAKRNLASGLTAERTPREVRLTKRISDEKDSASQENVSYPAEGTQTPPSASDLANPTSNRFLHDSASATLPIYTLTIPGEVRAPAFGLVFKATVATPSSLEPAEVRAWRPGDRITLAHSSGPKKVKEVLARMHISGDKRAAWPVVAWRGEILWMQGVNAVPLTSDYPSVSAHPLD